MVFWMQWVFFYFLNVCLVEPEMKLTPHVSPIMQIYPLCTDLAQLCFFADDFRFLNFQTSSSECSELSPSKLELFECQKSILFFCDQQIT